MPKGLRGVGNASESPSSGLCGFKTRVGSWALTLEGSGVLGSRISSFGRAAGAGYLVSPLPAPPFRILLKARHTQLAQESFFFSFF